VAAAAQGHNPMGEEMGAQHALDWALGTISELLLRVGVLTKSCQRSLFVDFNLGIVSLPASLSLSRSEPRHQIVLA
jgi:hypothetical protein